MMTNLPVLTATKTQSNTLLTGPSVATVTHSISTMSGHAGIQIRFTEETRSTTFDMIEPDEHDGDYAEERHDAICQMRDIDQGIKPLIEDDEDEE